MKNRESDRTPSSIGQTHREGDPTRNISDIRRVVRVVKDGKVSIRR